jgi:hypothetical protein
MTELPALLAMIDLLRKTAAASRSLQKDGEVTDRKEVLRLRCNIMELMIDISNYGQNLSDQQGRKEFLNEFAKLRSLNVAHHACWPVVMIRLEDPEYAVSIKAVRDQYQRFFSFVDRRYGGGAA